MHNARFLTAKWLYPNDGVARVFVRARGVCCGSRSTGGTRLALASTGRDMLRTVLDSVEFGDD